MLERRLKIGSFLMFGMGVFTLIMGFLRILVPEIVLSDFLYYTGSSFDYFLAQGIEYATIYLLTKQLVGLMTVAISIPVMFISYIGYSKGEMWSWFALLITGGFLWGSLTVYGLNIGLTSSLTISSVFANDVVISSVFGLVLWLFGLLIPVKDIFQKSITLQNLART